MAWQQPLPQHLEQAFGMEGLGNEAVHAGFEAFHPVVGEGIGGQGEDRRLAVAGQLSNLACRLQATHHRHLHVHQNKVVASVRRHVDGLGTVVGDVKTQSRVAEKFAHNFLAEWLAVRQ